jgi:alkylhydroperoxidase/carboxymuconolactone decarboxylase family protein YurZ
MQIDSTQLHNLARQRCAGLADGSPLDPLDSALITLGVAASVTALDRAAIDSAINSAFDAGASVRQVQEIMALISALGVHSLMCSAVSVLEAAKARGLVDAAAQLSPAEQALWDEYVGSDPFWTNFEQELPGFLNALLRLSPDVFSAFFAYCAVPWTSGTVRARIKELTAMATDATAQHCFGPGFRVHLNNAIKLGAGRLAINQTLTIAASAPLHRGIA